MTSESSPKASHISDELEKGFWRGWQYIRLRPDGNTKQPMDKGFGKGCKKSPVNCEELRDWVSKGHNLGIITGAASGLVVVDIDLKKDDNGQPIESSDIAYKIVEFLGLPDTPTLLTGTGGLHLYFALPTGREIPNSAGNMDGHIDIRGEGGYIVAPGSTHHLTGETYAWVPGRDPDSMPMAEFPTQLVETLKKPKVEKTLEPLVIDSSHPEYRDRIKRCMQIIADGPNAVCGNNGHDKTFFASCECARWGLDMNAAEWVMDWFNREKTEGDYWTLKELRHKIDDAYKIVTEAGEFGVRLRDEEGPRPLRRTPTAPEPFPFDALGDILGPATRAIHRVVQAPDSVCGNSILAAASLSVQAHADVEIDGRVSPTSLFCLSIAGSGERKSAVDKVVLAPHRAYERELGAQFKEEKKSHDRACAAFESKRKGILNKKKLSRDAMESELAELGDAPEPLLLPILLTDDFTIEGLHKLLGQCLPFMGIISDEGARTVGGNAMIPENLLKTIGTLSNLWDARPTTRVRAGDGVLSIAGKRVCLHLMMQPVVANLLFASQNVQGQGFLWRCLPAWPATLSGTRKYSDENIYQDANYRHYADRLADCLRQPWPVKPDDNTELEPRHLYLTRDAKELYVEFYNEIEKNRGPEGPYAPVSAFASRVPEHAVRIAGVLTLVRDTKAEQIKIQEIQQGIELASWYLREAMRIHEAAIDDPQLVLAEQLLQWMQSRPSQPIKTTDVYQFGPNQLRSAKAAHPILQILEGHGWIKKAEGKAKAWVLVT